MKMQKANKVTYGFKGMWNNKSRSYDGRSVTYKKGNIYIQHGKIELSEQGLHFCDVLSTVDCYFSFNDPRTTIAIVECSGKFDGKPGMREKLCCSKMKVLEVLSHDEVLQLVEAAEKMRDRFGYDFDICMDRLGDKLLQQVLYPHIVQAQLPVAQQKQLPKIVPLPKVYSLPSLRQMPGTFGSFEGELLMDNAFKQKEAVS